VDSYKGISSDLAATIDVLSHGGVGEVVYARAAKVRDWSHLKHGHRVNSTIDSEGGKSIIIRDS